MQCITRIQFDPKQSFARLPSMNPPFRIDPSTGRIFFPDLPLELRPGLPEPEFVEATSQMNRDNLGANDRWQRYSLRSSISEDRKIGMFLIFFAGRLKRLSVAWSHRDATWDNWSKENELALRKEFQGQIDSQLNGKSVFSWGEINTVNDSKGGGSNIWVNYSDLST